jgi:hypothetical protein
MTKRLYEHEAGSPASEDEISAFEVKHGITFQDDYRAFLLETRSLYITENVDDIFEEGELWQDWPFDVNEFEGLKVSFEYFFDSKFLRIGYVIGSDGGGNPMLQLTAGKHSGKIAMLDHEIYYGGMDQILNVENGHYPGQPKETVAFKTFDAATPDQIVDECEKIEALEVFEMTFREYITQIDELYALAYRNRLVAK